MLNDVKLNEVLKWEDFILTKNFSNRHYHGRGINVHVIKDRLGHIHNSLDQEKIRFNIFDCLAYNYKNKIFILNWC